jgi:hypothetical protein
VLLALGGHTFVGRASWYVPVISYVREPVRALFLYQFGAAVLAALGTQLVIDRLPRRQTAAAGFTLLMATGILAEAVGARDWVILSMDSPFAPARYYADDALVRFLKERVARDSRLYRIADPSRVLPPNIGNVYALHSTGGHRATMSAGYFDFMSRDWSLRSEGHRLIGARYLVSPNRLSGFPEIFQSERGYVFERADVLPVFQVVTASGERKAAQVSSVVWSENSVSFALDNAVAGELVFAQPAYPGWRVTLDGQTRMPVTSDAFMSVPLTGDERRVTWAYTPGFRWVGCATAALVVAGALWSLRAPRPRRDARRLEVGGH